jgi:hypothetical protein
MWRRCREQAAITPREHATPRLSSAYSRRVLLASCRRLSLKAIPSPLDDRVTSLAGT